MLRGQVLFCLNHPIKSKGSVSWLIPQVRGMLQLPLVGANYEESRHGPGIEDCMDAFFTLPISYY